MLAAEETRASARLDDLELLLDTARHAGQIALGYFRKSPEVWMKIGESPVTEADFAVNRYLEETLRPARPQYGWLSEETADTPERLETSRVFVVDPIDGTRGFIEGLRTWCVSIAVVQDGVTIAGVLQCPATDETYWATPGEGAWKNGKRLRVRDTPDRLDVAGSKRFLDALPLRWRDRVCGASHVPSLAYRIAMIADGRLDATFVKPHSHDWDLAAADLILREAGGVILTPEGRMPAYCGESPRQGPLIAGREPFASEFAASIAQPSL